MLYEHINLIWRNRFFWEKGTSLTWVDSHLGHAHNWADIKKKKSVYLLNLVGQGVRGAYQHRGLAPGPPGSARQIVVEIIVEVLNQYQSLKQHGKLHKGLIPTKCECGLEIRLTFFSGHLLIYLFSIILWYFIIGTLYVVTDSCMHFTLGWSIVTEFA